MPHSGASLAILAFLVLGLAGCAALDSGISADPPYVGVFMGEFVEGKPLYRFPTIHVVGSRSDVGGI